MNSRLWLCALSSITLVGCASAPAQSEKTYDPTTSARIRVFGQNGIGIVVFPGKNCYPETDEGGMRASGGMGQSFGSMFGSQSNVTIGMPATKRSRHPVDQRLAKEFFTEYVLPANKPTTIKMGFSTAGAITQSCRSFGATFTPLPGTDYEATLFVDKRQCIAVLNEIDAGNGDIRAVKNSTRASSCDQN